MSADHDKAVSLYESGLSAMAAAKQIGRSECFVFGALHKAGVKSRTYEQTHRRYSVDADFFAKIDTEAKAYWLGFITADGNVYKNPCGRSRRLVIGLALADIDHLKRFMADIKSEHRLITGTRSTTIAGRDYKDLAYCRVEIVCKKIYSDLLALGIYPNKTHTVQPCERVPAHLARHYWRGLVDGDGCIHIARRGGERYVSLCGSIGIVSGFRDYCATLVDVSRAKIIERPGLFRVTFGGLLPTQKICTALYGGSTVFLERKKELAEAIIRSTGQKKHYQYLTRDEIQQEIDRHGSIENAAHAKSWALPALKRQARKLGFNLSDGRKTRWARIGSSRAKQSRPEQLTLFGGSHVG